MSEIEDLELQLKKKAARKAKPGGWPKLRNIPRNWLHQAVTYMDAGELLFRVFVEFVEFAVILFVLKIAIPDMSIYALLGISFVIVHTWNWVTNGLFWAVIIFTFPGLTNPGKEKTVKYLNDMAGRLKRSPAISGLAVYGSATRGGWHNRSDTDIRIVRHPGLLNLLRAAMLTMQERFLAFLARQPMDLFLADGPKFLKKMRSDEIPLLLIKRDKRLDVLYPGNDEQLFNKGHLKDGF